MAENVFKKARLKAAETNPVFKTAESALAKLPTISKERLYMIEQENPHKRRIDPTPYDVWEMSKAYNAPELCDYFCTHLCRLGENRTPLMYNNLGEISANLMSAFHFLENVNDQIHSILADSMVTENEKEEFKNIIKTLRNFSYSADSLELWAKKNGFID